MRAGIERKHSVGSRRIALTVQSVRIASTRDRTETYQRS